MWPLIADAGRKVATESCPCPEDDKEQLGDFCADLHGLCSFCSRELVSQLHRELDSISYSTACLRIDRVRYYWSSSNLLHSVVALMHRHVEGEMCPIPHR